MSMFFVIDAVRKLLEDQFSDASKYNFGFYDVSTHPRKISRFTVLIRSLRCLEKEFRLTILTVLTATYSESAKFMRLPHFDISRTFLGIHLYQVFILQECFDILMRGEQIKISDYHQSYLKSKDYVKRSAHVGQHDKVRKR